MKVAHWLPEPVTSGVSELFAVSVELNTRLIGSKRAALPKYDRISPPHFMLWLPR